MERPALALLVVAFFNVAVFAQSTNLTGTVIDARTGQPLAHVAISVDNPPLSAETDADGRFQLAVPPGRFVLTASFVGYALFRQTITAASGDNQPLLIRLSEGAGQFEEQVTVAGSASNQAESVPAGASLHGRELQALRGITLDDPLRAMQSLPSVAATDDFYSEFAVRGSSFRHVGLVVDGVPTRYLMHSVYGIPDGGSITMVNSDAVGSLSLLPGAYPQQWGRHVGAQVGIEMRPGDRQKFHSRAGLSGTSAAFLTEGPLPRRKGSWLVSARRSYLDLLLRRIDPENTLAFGFTDAEAKTVVDLTPRHQLEALVIAGRSQFNDEPDQLGPNDEADIKGHAWLSALTWRFTPSSGFVVTQKAYGTGLTFRNRNRYGDLLDTVSSAELGWRADATAAPRAGVLLEFGAEAQTLAGNHRRSRALSNATTLTTLADYDRSGGALSGYVQTAINVGRLTITPGVRGDHWGPTRDSTASPWMLADFALTSSTRLRGGAGVYRQFPDFEEIAGLQGGGDGLRPETSRHLDVGLSQQLRRELTLQVTGYLRNESDILWTPGSEPRRIAPGVIRLGRSDAPWVNLLTGRARGVEIVLRRDSPSRLSGWAGYAYGRDRYMDRTTGESFWADYDQRHAMSLFGQYRLSNRTTVGAKFRYGSNYPIVGYIGPQTVVTTTPAFIDGRQLFYGLTDVRNTLRLPSYARLDVRADRTFNWSKRRVTVFGEVANALNRQNLRNVPYGVGRNGLVQEPTDTLLPIVPSAGLVIDF